MMLTTSDVTLYLSVTEKWLRDVIADGRSSLAVHSRLRRDESVAAKRSAVRFPLKSLWLYVCMNTISGQDAQFPDTAPNESAALITMDELREEIHWLRCGQPHLPGDAIRTAMVTAGISEEQVEEVIGRLRKIPIFRSRIA